MRVDTFTHQRDDLNLIAADIADQVSHEGRRCDDPDRPLPLSDRTGRRRLAASCPKKDSRAREPLRPIPASAEIVSGHHFCASRKRVFCSPKTTLRSYLLHKRPSRDVSMNFDRFPLRPTKGKPCRQSTAGLGSRVRIREPS
jgi:hypothetical protein